MRIERWKAPKARDVIARANEAVSKLCRGVSPWVPPSLEYENSGCKRERAPTEGRPYKLGHYPPALQSGLIIP